MQMRVLVYLESGRKTALMVWLPASLTQQPGGSLQYFTGNTPLPSVSKHGRPGVFCHLMLALAGGFCICQMTVTLSVNHEPLQRTDPQVPGRLVNALPRNVTEEASPGNGRKWICKSVLVEMEKRVGNRLLSRAWRGSCISFFPFAVGRDTNSLSAFCTSGTMLDDCFISFDFQEKPVSYWWLFLLREREGD